MKTNVTVKIAASTLSVMMVVFSVGMPFVHATVEIPSVEVPNVNVPSVEIPAVQTPEVEVPEVETPEVEVPEVEVPSVETPEVEVPSVDIPEVEIPQVDIPQVNIPTVEIPEVEIPEIDNEVSSTFCRISAGTDVVTTGGSVTVSWETAGFDTITINGEEVNAASDSKTFENITENTIFKLEASNGNSNCSATVNVTCIPHEAPKQCRDFGFDFDVAKAEWEGNYFSLGSVRDGYSVTISGNAESATWTSDPAVDGVVVKAATNRKVYGGGTSGDVVKADVGAGKHDLSHVLWCGNESDPEPEPQPRCDMYANPTTIKVGESAQLTWTSSEVFAAAIDNGVGVVSPNDSTSVSPLQTTTYTFTGEYWADENQNDYLYCPVTITVEEPEEKECKLKVEKAVNTQSAKPGDTLTYTIDIENIGTADCTGGGVRIFDELSSDLTFQDVTYTSNLSAGYSRNPVYKEEVVRFNGHTLTPGEKGQMVIFAKVNETQQCGNFEIANQAKTTARELNNFQDWAFSNTVTTMIDNQCDHPERPVCPYTPMDGRVIVDFQDRLRSDKPAQHTSDLKSVDLGAGTYKVSLASWDGYLGRENTPAQPLEQWTIGFLAGSEWVVNSNSVDDVADGVQSDFVVGVANESLVIDQAITQIQAEHVYTQSDKTANSVNPICAAFDKEPEEEEPEAPICESFTATPNSFNNGTGGDVTLTWDTTNAQSVSIDNGVGAVELDGNVTVDVTENTNFVLTVVGEEGTQDAQCEAPVTITEPEPTLTCDSFTASDTSLPRGGARIDLTWETTDATEVSINNGIGNVAVDGTESNVSVTSDTQFTLTAQDDNGNKVYCDVDVNVATGGGGGGSSSPRCDLDISAKKIKAGEDVVITWDNTRTNEMVLEDNRGNVLIDTEDDNEYDEDEGSITVNPKRDTEYTMTASRGSRDRTCRVEVEMDDDVTVIESRTQTPVVAGIALSNVPYTGFEAGPILTFIFYTFLALWAAFVAYMLVVRERTVMGVSLTGANKAAPKNDSWENLVDHMHDNLDYDIDVTKEEPTPVAAKETSISPSVAAPANLPTGEAPVFGYQALNKVAAPIADEEIDPMTELENAAHNEQALLSSDAINYFMESYQDAKDRYAALHAVIADAKAQFPTEGGWMVLNLDRVEKLAKVEDKTPGVEAMDFIPETRVGVSSLAEAVVSGNIAAAYELIGHRPMFALADAAADLDAVYRTRKGMEATASELLVTKTANLSDEQITEMIKALTSSLDGAYTDEEAAVKMAIMKAVKVAG